MYHPDPDLLALAALPSEPRDPAVEHHLATCPLCHGHVESLRRTVELAVAGGTGGEDEDPPDRIWTAITGELAIAAPDAAEPVRRRRRLAVPVAAAVIGVLAGLGIGLAVTGGPAAERPLATLTPLADAPGSSGTAALAERDGVRAVVVRVEGVATPAGSDYLEAWLMDASGTRLVSLGALAGDGDGFVGTFTVPADLPLGEFGTVDVSAERWDGDATHSSDSLLRGTIT